MNAYQKTIQILKNAVPSNGIVAGIRTMGYVPAGTYRVANPPKCGKTCIVHANQVGSPYEGAYYWVNTPILKKLS